MAGGSPIPRPATAVGPLADRGTADGPEPVTRARPHEIRASGAPEASASFLPELAGRFGVRPFFLKGTKHAFSTLALLAGLITTSAHAANHLPPIEEGGIYPIGGTVLCDEESQLRDVLAAFEDETSAGYARELNEHGESSCAFMRQAGRYIVTDITHPVYKAEGGEYQAVEVQYVRVDGEIASGWLMINSKWLGGLGA